MSDPFFLVDQFTLIRLSTVAAVTGDPETRTITVYLTVPGPNGDHRLTISDPDAVEGFQAWTHVRIPGLRPEPRSKSKRR